MMDKNLSPVHNLIPSFLQPSSSPHQLHTSFVSAQYLVRDCPAFLTAVTHGDHPDQETWLQIYQEEKQSLYNHSVYTVIDRDEYQRLQCDCNSPRSISTMAYLGFKRQINYNPYCAKSYIIVLGNHKYWDLKNS